MANITDEEKEWLLEELKDAAQREEMTNKAVYEFCEKYDLGEVEEWPGFGWHIVDTIGNGNSFAFYSEDSGSVVNAANLLQNFIKKTPI